MRINQFVARASGLSRRAADSAIMANQVYVNGVLAVTGQLVDTTDVIELNKQRLTLPDNITTIIMNKPIGYVCSRKGQGNKTIYDLLPTKFHTLKPIGRLDKDSSGLILLTNDGYLAHKLTHPSFNKEKVYHVRLNMTLQNDDKKQIELGINLDDGISALKLKQLATNREWEVKMHEGRNRQVRRTFSKLGYTVLELKRLSFANYNLNGVELGKFKIIL